MAEPSERNREIFANELEATEHQLAARVRDESDNSSGGTAALRAIAAARAEGEAEGVAQERAAWKEWAEETIKGTAEGQRIARAEGEAEGRRKAVENPEIESFLDGVRVEAAHQVKRWGEAHDRGKSAENWYWLIGYLAGKALRSSIDGNRDKALHHTISSAAALFNWHQAIKADSTNHGLGDDRDLEEIARFDAGARAETPADGSGA